MRNAAEMFFFDPNPTTAKKAWPSSTCLLYGDHLSADDVRLGAELCEPAQAGQEEAHVHVENGQGRIL
jgi:hypothetical protein